MNELVYVACQVPWDIFFWEFANSSGFFQVKFDEKGSSFKIDFSDLCGIMTLPHWMKPCYPVIIYYLGNAKLKVHKVSYNKVCRDNLSHPLYIPTVHLLLSSYII
jgi:hypothetical protein